MNSTIKYLCIVLLIFIAQACFAQTANENFYAFKADWSAATSIDKSTYFMHEIKKSDTEYVCRYYNKFGPMIKQEVYKDSTLSTPNGFFCWYNEKGKLDSCGWVENFKKDSYWYYFMGDSLNSTYYDKYDYGKFLYRKSTAQPGADTAKEEKDSTQKEAVFKTGTKDWTNYVSQHLKVPDRFASNFKAGKYTATVSFTINKQGKTENIYLIQSLEWSADAVIFNLIENSPLWQPAIQKGKPVLYRQKESIKMALE